MTLPLLSHPCTYMLSTYVWICDMVAILYTKSRSCMSSAPSSRLFIFTSHVGLDEDTRRVWVVRENGGRQTKYCPSGSWHTPPIPDLDASVVPIQVGSKISNSRRWVGLLARLRTNLLQA